MKRVIKSRGSAVLPVFHRKENALGFSRFHIKTPPFIQQCIPLHYNKLLKFGNRNMSQNVLICNKT